MNTGHHTVTHVFPQVSVRFYTNCAGDGFGGFLDARPGASGSSVISERTNILWRTPTGARSLRRCSAAPLLQPAFVLERKSQQRTRALTLEGEFAAHTGAMVLDGPVTD